ncbi:uncharacterized protein [Scyliorhinus torazame]|uniref:uncharacterized protein isoform X1 n=1 Tax=Scyliorhinus torazame TaxID=75743 RepID=UPI003B5BA877
MEKIYRVFEVGLKGERIPVDISHSETEFNELKITKFKEKLLQKLLGQAAAADDLRILFASVQVEDGKTFLDYNIKDQSTLLMVLPLPGGGPMPARKSGEDLEREEPLDGCGNTLQTVICTAAKPMLHQEFGKN